MRPNHLFTVWLTCKILTVVTAARERPDALIKAASASPLLATFLLHGCKRPLQPYKSSAAAHKSTVQTHEDASASKGKLWSENCSQLFCRSPSLCARPAPKHHFLFPNTCKTPYLATALSTDLKAGEDGLCKAVRGWNEVAIKPPPPPPPT